MHAPLVVDIETVGMNWDDLDPAVQRYLLERARNEEERQAVPERLGLHPATGRIVAIGLWRPDQDRGGVLVEGPADHEAGWQPFEDGALIFRGPEERLLREFWRYVSEGAGTIVTFNGRFFDGPYLMLRSAMLGIAPTRNLVPYRYSFREHCDLAEVLTFHRLRPLESFDFWCRQFGIASPKDELAGAGVAAAYAEGNLDRIARYCLRDVRATAELYRRLQPLIELMDRGVAG
ncbi:MAG TPA: ribonuclease H-like domain-containing protein [Bacillota bacterium]